MGGRTHPESILAADIGSTLTHVCLIERVENIFRLVALAESPSTVRTPERDLSLAVRRAVKRIEYVIQRPLLSQDEELLTPEQDSGVGVDCFVATCSAAEPLRCVIVGLTDDLSVASAQTACASANVSVVRSVSLGARMRRWDDRVLAALHADPPDLILLVGGLDAGPVAMLESAARTLVAVFEQVDEARRPIVVFAGNQEARRALLSVLSPVFSVRVVENVRPLVRSESVGELQRELLGIYENSRLPALPGYERIQRWCTGAILSTWNALGVAWRFVARRNELLQGIVGVDIGGATTQVGAVRGDSYQTVVAAQLGTSYGVRHVVEQSGLGSLRRWMPIVLKPDDLANRLENVCLRPQTIPQTMEDQLLVHAVARQAALVAMRHMRRQFWSPTAVNAEPITPPFDLIAARGGVLAHTPQDGLVAMTLLDSIQPVGLTRIVLDWASIWPQLGALASVAPLAASQVMERDGFKELGTVIAPVGEAEDDEPALHLKISVESGDTLETEVPAGVVQHFPLRLEQQAIIEAHPTRRFDLGLGRRGIGGRTKVRGGSLGIIVDTRGRPLSLPQDARLQRSKLQQWLAGLIEDVDRSA